MNLTRVDKVFKLFKITHICFFIFLSISVFSQTQPVKSTSIKDSSSTIKEEELIKRTREYITKKEYRKAASFLSKYYDNFSESLNVNWLYAHVLSINNDKKEAEVKFKKAISLSPNNKNLQLDYARFFYEMGKIDKVASILSVYMDEDSKNVEFLLMQANINFWKGDLKNAQKKINRIKEIYPNTNIADNLIQQIEALYATYLKTNFEYQTDTQPLDYFASHIVLSEYVSKYFHPQLEISRYSFSPQKEGALIIKLGNQFYFNKLNLKANLKGGVYINHSGTSDWVAGLDFTQKLPLNITLKAGYSKERLLSTIASTTFNLTTQNIFGVLDYSNKFIVLNAAYNHQFYEDDNVITTIGSWIVSQPIKIQKFNFQFGYGYNFTDSEDVLFVYDSNGLGVYDPYFTPKNQQIHSGLLITNYKPTEKLSFQVKANYGFKATVRNPYQIKTAANTFEVGGFYDEEFTYTEINGAINYAISNGFSMNANYIYQDTFFYTRNNINLGLNFTF